MPLWFSNDIEYWKPEHPPPTTPIRRPAGTGSCVAIISFTLAIAAGVRVTGWVEAGVPVTTSAGGVTVAVAIGQISLYIYLFSVVPLPPQRQAHAKKRTLRIDAPRTSKMQLF